MTTPEFQAWLQRSPAQRQPLIMGILNATPDSFSDGGLFIEPSAAAEQALRMISEGADLIDIGGESSRPGSQAVAEEEQIRRTAPIIRAICQAESICCSIDTTRANVAAAALDAGASIINDISGGRDDAALISLAAIRQAPIVLMHMQGTPATMHLAPSYSDVTREVVDFLAARADAAIAAGVLPYRILLDPGIGFGKTLRHDLQLLQDLPEMSRRLTPHSILVGASRKSFIGKITGVAAAADRVFGTAATVAWSVANGVGLVRVHDVAPMAQVVRMIGAIQGGERFTNGAGS